MIQHWNIIEQYASVLKQVHLKELFIEDAGRVHSCSHTLPFAFIDYSRQRVNAQLLEELCVFAREINIREQFVQMMQGAKINVTEQRSVLHTALRAPKDSVINIDGQNIMPEIHAVLDRIRVFSDSIRRGALRGYSGKTFTDIVNIGIGGSDLGRIWYAMRCDIIQTVIFQSILCPMSIQRILPKH
jgi:glucose-6-phosphate isomerase